MRVSAMSRGHAGASQCGSAARVGATSKDSSTWDGGLASWWAAAVDLGYPAGHCGPRPGPITRSLCS